MVVGIAHDLGNRAMQQLQKFRAVRRLGEAAGVDPIDQLARLRRRHLQGRGHIGCSQLVGQRHDQQGVQDGFVKPAQALDQRELRRLRRGLRTVGHRADQEWQARGAGQQVLSDG